MAISTAPRANGSFRRRCSKNARGSTGTLATSSTSTSTATLHFANSNEEQIERIARLGALVTANPYYPVGFADKYGEVGLGPQRADVMLRANSVLKSAISLSYHSDLPMGPAAPLMLAWCGVNRVTHFWPSCRTRAANKRRRGAARGHNRAAYSWRQEDRIGSIAPGKIANFTALEADPYEVEPIKLNDILSGARSLRERFTPPFEVENGLRPRVLRAPRKRSCGRERRLAHGLAALPREERSLDPFGDGTVLAFAYLSW